jgi:hypothetical protein
VSATPDSATARGPLSAVLEAFRDGVRSFDDVAARCDLSVDVVRACVDHLVRIGRLEATELAVGCPTGGCGSCALSRADGTAGCGATGPSDTRTGAVAVAISLRRPARADP